MHSPLVRQEYTVSYRAMAGMFSQLVVTTKSTLEKNRFIMLYQVVMEDVKIFAPTFRRMIVAAIDRHEGSCNFGRVPGIAGCAHHQAVKAQIPSQYPDFAFILECINFMTQHAADCPCMASALLQVGGEIDRRSKHWLAGAQEPAGIPDATTLALSRVTYGTAKTRIDEDLKHQISVEMLKNRELTNANDFIRHTGAASSSASGTQWALHHCLRSQAASFLAFEETQRYRVATDGTRLGKPAEETNVYLVTDPLQKLGTDAAPQVQ